MDKEAGFAILYKVAQEVSLMRSLLGAKMKTLRENRHLGEKHSTSRQTFILD